jgi:PQ loop repeat
MLTATQIGGFVGAGLAGAAYVPQIFHLIRARCSAGISRLAFGVWLLSSVLVTARAVAIGAGVFIVLGAIQIVATALIVVCAARYKDTPCPVHRPRQPAVRTAAGPGTPGTEPGSWRPAGRPVATSAGHGGALRAYVPVLQPYFHEVSEFQATHLRGRT